MAELTMVASMLRHLRLSDAAVGLESVVAEAALAESTPLEVLNQLLQMEIDGRNAKGKARRLKAACFPYVEDLESFDFQRKGFKGINKAHMRQLADLAWLEKAYNIRAYGLRENQVVHRIGS